MSRICVCFCRISLNASLSEGLGRFITIFVEGKHYFTQRNAPWKNELPHPKKKSDIFYKAKLRLHLTSVYASTILCGPKTNLTIGQSTYNFETWLRNLVPRVDTILYFKAQLSIGI